MKNSNYGNKYNHLNNSHSINSGYKGTRNKTVNSFFNSKKKKKGSYSIDPERKNSRRNFPKNSFELPLNKSNYKSPIFEKNSGRGRSSSRRGLSMYLGIQDRGNTTIGSFTQGKKNMKIRNIKLRQPLKGGKLRKKPKG